MSSASATEAPYPVFTENTRSSSPYSMSSVDSFPGLPGRLQRPAAAGLNLKFEQASPNMSDLDPNGGGSSPWSTHRPDSTSSSARSILSAGTRRSVSEASSYGSASPYSAAPSPLSTSSTIDSSPATPSDNEDSWNLIPYHVPWGSSYHEYEAGTLPGPEGACVFLRSPTPLKNQRTTQACEKCRERKAKCSGTRPSCARCQARGHICSYVNDTSKRNNRGSQLNRRRRRDTIGEIPLSTSHREAGLCGGELYTYKPTPLSTTSSSLDSQPEDQGHIPASRHEASPSSSEGYASSDVRLRCRSPTPEPRVSTVDRLRTYPRSFEQQGGSAYSLAHSRSFERVENSPPLSVYDEHQGYGIVSSYVPFSTQSPIEQPSFTQYAYPEPSGPSIYAPRPMRHSTSMPFLSHSMPTTTHSMHPNPNVENVCDPAPTSMPMIQSMPIPSPASIGTSDYAAYQSSYESPVPAPASYDSMSSSSVQAPQVSYYPGVSYSEPSFGQEYSSYHYDQSGQLLPNANPHFPAYVEQDLHLMQAYPIQNVAVPYAQQYL